MNETLLELIKLVIPIGIFGLLGFAISQARRVTNDVMNHIYKVGQDDILKTKITFKVLFNFYLTFAVIFVVASAYMNMITEIQYFYILICILITFGVKLTLDIILKIKS